MVKSNSKISGRAARQLGTRANPGNQAAGAAVPAAAAGDTQAAQSVASSGRRPQMTQLQEKTLVLQIQVAWSTLEALGRNAPSQVDLAWDKQVMKAHDQLIQAASVLDREKPGSRQSIYSDRDLAASYLDRAAHRTQLFSHTAVEDLSSVDCEKDEEVNRLEQKFVDLTNCINANKEDFGQAIALEPTFSNEVMEVLGPREFWRHLHRASFTVEMFVHRLRNAVQAIRVDQEPHPLVLQCEFLGQVLSNLGRSMDSLSLSETLTKLTTPVLADMHSLCLDLGACAAKMELSEFHDPTLRSSARPTARPHP
jgi:hypothetical protein